MQLNPELLSLETYEDAEQACAVSHPPVVLHYDPVSFRVLRGRWAGQRLAATERLLFAEARAAGLEPSLDLLMLRPWWRGFRSTPAVRVTCSPLLGAR